MDRSGDRAVRVRIKLLILLAVVIMAFPVLLISLIVYGIRNAPEDDDEDSTYIAAALPFLDDW